MSVRTSEAFVGQPRAIASSSARDIPSSVLNSQSAKNGPFPAASRHVPINAFSSTVRSSMGISAVASQKYFRPRLDTNAVPPSARVPSLDGRATATIVVNFTIARVYAYRQRHRPDNLQSHHRCQSWELCSRCREGGSSSFGRRPLSSVGPTTIFPDQLQSRELP
jgi:hypothetical protein